MLHVNRLVLPCQPATFAGSELDAAHVPLVAAGADHQQQAGKGEQAQREAHALHSSGDEPRWGTVMDAGCRAAGWLRPAAWISPSTHPPGALAPAAQPGQPSPPPPHLLDAPGLEVGLALAHIQRLVLQCHLGGAQHLGRVWGGGWQVWAHCRPLAAGWLARTSNRSRVTAPLVRPPETRMPLPGFECHHQARGMARPGSPKAKGGQWALRVLSCQKARTDLLPCPSPGNDPPGLTSIE